MKEITTEDIINGIKYPKIKYFGERTNQSEERFLINNYNPCEQSDSLNYSPYHYDIKSIKRGINDEFYNYDIMKGFSCLLNQISNSSPDVYSRYLTIHSNIGDLIKIGEESVFGDVFLAEIGKNREKILVIKTPKANTANRSLIHEAFVGLFGTNTLRKYIPNFSYVYGYFDCSLLFYQQTD